MCIGRSLSKKFLVFACAVLVCCPVLIYSQNINDEIPNGNMVPHPCKDEFWPAVGNQDMNGTGMPNSFGEQFEAAGSIWSSDFCNADSDGDGKSNGEELGDPDCLWTAGDIPTNTTGLSHPGICEPIDSEECEAKNWDLGCPDDEDGDGDPECEGDEAGDCGKDDEDGDGKPDCDGVKKGDCGKDGDGKDKGVNGIGALRASFLFLVVIFVF